MRNHLKKYLTGVALFLAILFIGTSIEKIGFVNIGTQYASVLELVGENSAKIASGYAWSDTVGWINFGDTEDATEVEGRVYVSDNELYGYAWGENIGWISMNCENDESCGTVDYAVTQSSSNGTLTGYAWGENIGWINFAPDGGGVFITTNTSGINNFSGYAWGENIGWISFVDEGVPYGVTTAWTKSVGGSVTQTCTYNDPPEWSACENSEQTRTLTALVVPCIGEQPTKIETRSCTIAVATTTPISISISPVSTTTFVGKTVKFTATVTGTTTNQNVTWLVYPIEYDPYYGTIDNNGLYTAPSSLDPAVTNGITAIVIAKSQADFNKQATSTVLIKPATATTTATTTPPTATTTPPTATTTEKATSTDSEGKKIVPIGGSNNHESSSTDDIAEVIISTSTKEIVVLGTTTKQIIADTRKILESKTGSTVTNTFTTAGVVGGSIAMALSGATVADLLSLPFRLWGLLLSFLGLRKRHRPWGTVYDSVTKQPIDPAYVTLKNLATGEETISITDLDGRYGFVVAPGKYLLTANKTNYSFPSKKLAGKNEDELYNNLYAGEEIEVTDQSTVIRKNIPLDPIKFDWNEFVKGKKKLMKFYSRRDKITRKIIDWVFRIGFGLSILSLILITAPYNLIIFGLYVVLVILRKLGFKQKVLGSLSDKGGNPLSFAIIRVMSEDLNIEITNKVADKIGRYYCLVPKGKYYVKVEKKNDDESYTLIHTSSVFEATDGIVNKNFISA